MDNKNFDRFFSITVILGVVWVLVLISAVIAGIYLAIKNWG